MTRFFLSSNALIAHTHTHTHDEKMVSGGSLFMTALGSAISAAIGYYMIKGNWCRALVKVLGMVAIAIPIAAMLNFKELGALKVLGALLNSAAFFAVAHYAQKGKNQTLMQAFWNPEPVPYNQMSSQTQFTELER